LNRQVFWTALIVYVLISFVPALALPNLIGMGKRKTG